jgi:hypothetical protein
MSEDQGASQNDAGVRPHLMSGSKRASKFLWGDNARVRSTARSRSRPGHVHDEARRYARLTFGAVEAVREGYHAEEGPL